MHKIHVTLGVVLGKRGVGEANTLVAILTEELGLIKATARSARLDRSKLRYGLEPLTMGRFSFVRGKHEWKLVGVECEPRQFLFASLVHQKAAGKIARLLLRLIHGEEYSVQLFKTVSEGLRVLVQAKTKEEIEGIECVLVLRILSSLGYLPQTPQLQPFIDSDFSSSDVHVQALQARAFLIRTINESLLATGL